MFYPFRNILLLVGFIIGSSSILGADFHDEGDQDILTAPSIDLADEERNAILECGSWFLGDFKARKIDDKYKKRVGLLADQIYAQLRKTEASPWFQLLENKYHKFLNIFANSFKSYLMALDAIKCTERYAEIMGKLKLVKLEHSEARKSVIVELKQIKTELNSLLDRAEIEPSLDDHENAQMLKAKALDRLRFINTIGNTDASFMFWAKDFNEEDFIHLAYVISDTIFKIYLEQFEKSMSPEISESYYLKSDVVKAVKARDAFRMLVMQISNRAIFNFSNYYNDRDWRISFEFDHLTITSRTFGVARSRNIAYADIKDIAVVESDKKTSIHLTLDEKIFDDHLHFVLTYNSAKKAHDTADKINAYRKGEEYLTPDSPKLSDYKNRRLDRQMRRLERRLTKAFIPKLKRQSCDSFASEELDSSRTDADSSRTESEPSLTPKIAVRNRANLMESRTRSSSTF